MIEAASFLEALLFREQAGRYPRLEHPTEFDWGDDPPPRTRLHRSVIDEAHVRGLTRLHPELPEALRGTSAGIAPPAILRHLLARREGDTAAPAAADTVRKREARRVDMGMPARAEPSA